MCLCCVVDVTVFVLVENGILRCASVALLMELVSLGWEMGFLGLSGCVIDGTGLFGWEMGI